MHMADVLLSPMVGTTMCVISAASIAYSIKKINKEELCEKKVPVMAVMGAFVFAAQMINFTIPATGSSGHIGGGILLAAILGAYPALLAIASVLIIQCLFFADGGLLALGCNIFNMGVIPCLLVYPLLFKPFIKKEVTIRTITMASIISVVVGLQLGALGVVLETYFSGIAELPFKTFLLLMQPIHLAIGIAEGIITASVLGFVYQMRPEIMESSIEGNAIKSSVPMKNILVAFTVITIFTGGALSLFASENPDGLEWAIGKIVGTTELELKDNLMQSAASVQEATALMPDYDFKNSGETDSTAGTTVAGIAGGIVTFLIAGAIALVISYSKKMRKNNSEISV